MILLTETVLSYWDYLDELHRESSPESKEEYAGIKDWVGKLVSPKPLDPLLSHRSTGRSCHITSVSGAGSLTKGARVTPASARSSIRHSFDEPMVVDDGIPVAQSIRKGVKRPQDNQADAGRLRSSALPSKRAKTHHSVSGSQRSGSGVNNKYINSDLPSGCTINNAWRRLFISALAHYAAHYEDPWRICDEDFKVVLQVIWDVVYKHSIKHTVIIGGPVYHIAKQSLDNWRGGFAAVAVTVITAFFAHDADFEDPRLRMEFANSMLEKNRFLFSQNEGLDDAAWTGLWRSPFVLHTFAHHFNFIQGRIEIPQLNSEQECPHAALALSCAALRWTLRSVANDHVSFVSTTASGNTWTAILPQGGLYEFNENMWGEVTRLYLEPIKALSGEQFGLILEELQKYIKNGKGIITASSVDSADTY